MTPSRSLLSAGLLTLLAAGAWAADPPADRAFDAAVPPAQVRAAFVRFDPPALAALAAKVDAAEAALGRPRPGVSADQLYEIAARLAAERRDVATLGRLAGVARVAADPRLGALVSAARLVATASRAPDPEMTVALDQISPEQFTTFRGYLTQIHEAKALADRDALDGLAGHVGGVESLAEPQRRYLAKVVGAALQGLPEKPAAAQVAVKEQRDAAVREAPPEKPAPAAAAAANLPTLAGRTAAEVIDAGFEGRIDLVQVGAAWGRNDAVALGDYAFRMAEEERILRRPHRHVPAKTLFNAALGMAVTTSDADTLARLERGLTGDKGGPAPEFAGKDDLLTKIAASKTLALASRKGQEPLLAQVDQVTPESFALFRAVLGEFRSAAARRDAGMLTGLAEGLDTVAELDDAQRAYLARQAADARQAAPATPDPALAALQALGGVARSGGGPPLNQRVLAFALAQVGRKVDAGEADRLAARALEAAGARRLPPSPDADPVWGRPVPPAEGLPGDVVQLRDAAFRAAPPGQRVQPASYARHTAVIYQVLAPGYYVVLQQDVGPAGKAADRKKLVQVGALDVTRLEKGRASVYRPVAR